MTAGLRAALVEVLKWRARQLELACRLQTDVAVDALQRDDLAVFKYRLPAELGEATQQVADTAGLVP